MHFVCYVQSFFCFCFYILFACFRDKCGMQIIWSGLEETQVFFVSLGDNSALIYLDVIVHLWPRQKSNSTALISSPSHPHHWEVFKGWWSSRCTRIVQMYYFDWDFESARLLNSFLNHELKIRCTNWCWWMKVKYYSCIF